MIELKMFDENVVDEIKKKPDIYYSFLKEHPISPYYV